MIVEHISYNRLEERYDAAIFTESMPENMSRAIMRGRMFRIMCFPMRCRAVGGARFAEDLDAADEVVVYAKLPRSFQIPTPVGGYAPDWAIAFKRDAVKHVFFVAETKLHGVHAVAWHRAGKDCLRAQALQRDEHQRRTLPQRGNVRGPARGNGQDELGNAYES